MAGNSGFLYLSYKKTTGELIGMLGKKKLILNAPEGIKTLLRAYADEWFAHYNYQFVSNTLRGHRAPSVIRLLKQKSTEAFRRSNELAQRILEMGAQPISKLTDLERYATDKPFKLPRSLAD